MYCLYFDAMCGLKKKMVKKAQMPVKNLVVLASLMVIFFLIIGGIVLYFYDGSQDPVEQGVVESLLAEDTKNFIETMGPISEEEKEEMFLRDKELLNNAINNGGLNATKVYQDIYQTGNEVIYNLMQKFNITRGEAIELILIMEERRKQYYYMEGKDAYEMVKVDYMDFEEKLDAEVALPEAFMEDPALSAAQVAVVFKAESIKSFPEIYEKVTGEKLSGEEFANITLMDSILDYYYNLLGTTPLEFEMTSCTIGDEKKIMLRADDLISNDKKINYSVDRIIYAPNGKMIFDLSEENYIQKYSLNYTPETYVIQDLVKIPLFFPEGKYVVEYDIHDLILETKKVERVPLNCFRHLFIDNFYFILSLEDDVVAMRDNKFVSGEEVQVSFDLAGFPEDFDNEVEQFQLTWRVVAQDGRVVQEIISPPDGNLVVSQNEVLNYFGRFQLLEELDPGLYILLLKMEDLVHNMTIRSGKLMEVIEDGI